MKNKKIKFNADLLNFYKTVDNATLKKEYLLLNRDSIIEFTCECGKDFSKPFRNIHTYSGMKCRDCSLKNKLKKQLNTLNTIGFKSFTKDKLIELINEKNIQITFINNTKITSNDDIPFNIKRYDKITGKCQTKDCNNCFKKNLRLLMVKKLPFCYKCLKN